MNVARAQNLKSVSTMTTQDPYVKAKLLVDGYQVCCLPVLFLVRRRTTVGYLYGGRATRVLPCVELMVAVVQFDFLASCHAFLLVRPGPVLGLTVYRHCQPRACMLCP